MSFADPEFDYWDYIMSDTFDGGATFSGANFDATGRTSPARTSKARITTLGYSDFQPANQLGKFLAILETSIGVSLLALLVFVFGRRATR